MTQPSSVSLPDCCTSRSIDRKTPVDFLVDKLRLTQEQFRQLFFKGCPVPFRIKNVPPMHLVYDSQICTQDTSSQAEEVALLSLEAEFQARQDYFQGCGRY